MIKEILGSANPVLRKVSQEVKTITPEIQSLIKDMIDTLKSSSIKGVGLAAPQVGVSLRVIIALINENESEKILALINPRITVFKGEEEDYEGCLCLPNIYGKVKRAREITLEALNEKGDLINLNLKGLAARVVQHEIDHLDGILFVDRMDDPGDIFYEDQTTLFPN